MAFICRFAHLCIQPISCRRLIAGRFHDDTGRESTGWLGLGMELVMLDVVYLIGGCVFFVVAILYTTACDHL